MHTSVTPKCLIVTPVIQAHTALHKVLLESAINVLDGIYKLSLSGMCSSHMVLTAGVMGDVDASQVQLSPHLPSLPTESQLLIEECLSAVLLQRLDLPCCLHSIHHLQSSCPSVVIASVDSRHAQPLPDSIQARSADCLHTCSGPLLKHACNADTALDKHALCT